MRIEWLERSTYWPGLLLLTFSLGVAVSGLFADATLSIKSSLGAYALIYVSSLALFGTLSAVLPAPTRIVFLALLASPPMLAGPLLASLFSCSVATTSAIAALANVFVLVAAVVGLLFNPAPTAGILGPLPAAALQLLGIALGITVGRAMPSTRTTHVLAFQSWALLLLAISFAASGLVRHYFLAQIDVSTALVVVLFVLLPQLLFFLSQARLHPRTRTIALLVAFRNVLLPSALLIPVFPSLTGPAMLAYGLNLAVIAVTLSRENRRH
jgi:hypothetical protein